MGMILANITLNEISQIAKNKYYMTPLLVNIWNRKIHRDRSRSYQHLGGRKDNYRVSVWDDAKVLEIAVMAVQYCEYT